MTKEEKATSATEEEVWTPPTACPKCGSAAIMPVIPNKSVVCRDCGEETVCE